MLFVVEIPEADFNQSCVNRQTVAAHLRDVLRASSPNREAIEHPYGTDAAWEEFVFNRAQVKALDRDTDTALQRWKEAMVKSSASR